MNSLFSFSDPKTLRAQAFQKYIRSIDSFHHSETIPVRFERIVELFKDTGFEDPREAFVNSLHENIPPKCLRDKDNCLLTVTDRLDLSTMRKILQDADTPMMLHMVSAVDYLSWELMYRLEIELRKTDLIKQTELIDKLPKGADRWILERKVEASSSVIEYAESHAYGLEYTIEKLSDLIKSGHAAEFEGFLTLAKQSDVKALKPLIELFDQQQRDVLNFQHIENSTYQHT